MIALASSDQVRAIQTARRRQGLDEAAYRGALAGFGVVSTKALTSDQAATFLARLNGTPGRSATGRASGPFAAKLQALWIAAFNLGVVRDADDRALFAFVERVTGISHTRFLREPTDAAKAIEAIKAMLVRDGHVTWPRRSGPAAIHLKRAIVVAQILRLGELGRGTTDGTMPAETVWTVNQGSAAQLDALAKRLGATLRRHLSNSLEQGER